MCSLTWLLIEGAALLAYRIINRTPFSYTEARERLCATIGSDDAARGLQPAAGLNWHGLVEVLHPYFGFVADPHQSEPRWKVAPFGFFGNDHVAPIVKRAPDRVVVGVFGGSFAGVIYPFIKAALEEHGAAAGKPHVVINFATAGYKQPQQLLTLNYLLSLGAEFDIVINVDGFNEVALPLAENVPAKLNPFYPRMWDRRTASVVNRGTLRSIGRVEVAIEVKQRWAGLFRDRRLYVSPTLFLLWQTRDRKLARTIYQLHEKLSADRADAESFQMHGPEHPTANEEQLCSDLAAAWKNASLQMKILCEAAGTKYYHFLQPNQYLEGSKPISEAERKQAVNEASRYGQAVAKGYPLFIASGRQLQAAGVNFSDLTRIFADRLEILYGDDCCHTNDEGSAVVTRRIVETIYR
ncbi:MAG TPA: hypothetical protein VK993_08395 [Chthoniobacterales bacterium]|nr:hypothetical protein [Chthoniobacterales bacterium]